MAHCPLCLTFICRKRSWATSRVIVGYHTGDVVPHQATTSNTTQLQQKEQKQDAPKAVTVVIAGSSSGHTHIPKSCGRPQQLYWAPATSPHQWHRPLHYHPSPPRLITSTRSWERHHDTADTCHPRPTHDMYGLQAAHGYRETTQPLSEGTRNHQNTKFTLEKSQFTDTTGDN